MPDWDEESDTLSGNLRKAYYLSRKAAQDRVLPSLELVREWHITTMDRLDVPGDQYVGNFRGEDGLECCEVQIGDHQGTPSPLISQELDEFEQTLQKSVSALDDLIPQGYVPTSGDQLNAVIELCAWIHAEWVRIHPFANGNGRTARIWTGFIAMRYGVPPFVRLRPRPDGGYGEACSKAMQGNWAPTAQVFRRMYLDVFAI